MNGLKNNPWKRQLLILALFGLFLPMGLNAQPTPTSEDLSTPEIAARPDRYPPPKDALVLFIPAFMGGEGALGQELGFALAEAMHQKARYHVVMLQDIPGVGSTTAQSVWDKCEDYLGCLTLLGDHAQADVSIGATVSIEEDGALNVSLRLYDLEWGTEVSGLDLVIPNVQAVEPESPTPSSTVDPEASELEAETPTPTPMVPSYSEDALLALVLALDARLIPVHLTKVETVAAIEAAWEDAPTPPPLQGAEQVDIEGGIDALAKSLAAQDPKQRYTSAELRDAETEREILGLTPGEYGRYKRQNITESEWRQRLLGRSGQIFLRVDLGVLGGEVAQQYDGIVLMGDVSTDIVEKYARLLPAAGKTKYGRLGVAFSVMADAEAEMRIGFGQSSAEVRTLQAFESVYCTESAADGCVSEPKTENIPTRLFTMELLGRYYFRRPWDLKPYVSLGLEMMRLQDIPSAYELNSTFDFPLIYDPFPALWSVGTSGAVGVYWQATPNIALTAELPVYKRLLLGVADPLHFYASEPQVVVPPAAPDPTIAAGISFGLSMRLK